MAAIPEEFLVRLQHGIVGGFAPPTPNALHSLERSAGDPTNLFVQSATRPSGSRNLGDSTDKSLPVDDHAHLVQELHSILQGLPVESPPGSEDIYGMDTSITWMSEGFQWCNGGPQGCGGGGSSVQATDEQKAKFRRAVDIVTELTQK
ncbi:hypothetical protein CTheo_5592 [Ceratobasidium theobromae]|uniref:Uncharacterized protein n=1 Tax=Ceratobasidium theobromae TaxID=1582974 RepID=A0A5N5QHN9_9AGAM|nr:hypothetical protein CTheo_5592 [Ceratobasidium theobromae]